MTIQLETIVNFPNQKFLFDLEKQETEDKMLQLLETLRLSSNQNIFHIVYHKTENSKRSINKFWNLRALNNRKTWYLMQTPNLSGKTPLMRVLKSSTTNSIDFLNNHKEFFDYFTDLPVKIGKDAVPLQYLANTKKFEYSALYEYYLERTSLAATKPINGVSVLHQIVTAPKLDLKAVERALNYSKQKATHKEFVSFMNLKQSEGKTALVLAAERGSTATMDLLISFGAATDCAPYNPLGTPTEETLKVNQTATKATTVLSKCKKGKNAIKAQKRKQDNVPEESDESAAGYRTRKRSKRIKCTENDE